MVHFDLVWSFQLVRPKCPFQFDKIVVLSTALLYPAYKNNNQTCGGLGRVCATGMYHSIGHVEFPKFQTRIFIEWKAPKVYGQLCLKKHIYKMATYSWSLSFFTPFI